MEYIYNKTKLNEKLISYIENNIFPIYDKNEKAHDINHILTVINHAFSISKNYDVNKDMIFTIAAYHDIGHHIDKEKHEIISADIMIKDEKLKEFFTEDELKIIKEAIEDHRASSSHIPRTIYGKIVSAADKNLTVETAITRTYFYNRKYYPNLNESELYEEIYNHLNEKFGKNGYAKIYVKDEEYEKFKSELIHLLENKQEFFNEITKIRKKLQE